MGHFARRGKWMLALAIAAVSIITAGSVAAANGLDGNRPDFPESAVTVPARSIQVEGGYTFAWRDGDTEHVLGELLIRWGIMDRLELQIAVNSLVWNVGGGTAFGKDDPLLGVKLQVLRNDGTGPVYMPDLVLTIGGTIPVGFGDSHESVFRPTAGLGAAWTFSDTFSLNLNGIYSYDSDDGRRYHVCRAGTSFWITVTDRLDCYGEYYMIYPEAAGGTDAHYAGAGMTLLLVENFKVDLRGGIRLDRRREYIAGIGFVGRMDNLY
jgi:hypothetical protein